MGKSATILLRFNSFQENRQALGYRTHSEVWGIAWDLWEHPNGILHRTGSEVTMATLRKKR